MISNIVNHHLKQYFTPLFKSWQVVQFQPNVRYFAKTLLYPAPTSRILPSKEMLLETRAALGIKVLPEQVVGNLILMIKYLLSRFHNNLYLSISNIDI